MRRHPLPLTGFLGLVPPLQRYYEVLRLPAAHFAALRFLRLAIPSLRPWFVPPAPDAEPWINRELVGGISSRLARWKRQGLPSSRRNPCDHSPYSSDPGVTRQAEWTMSKLPGAAPATDHDEGSPRVVISGLNRTAFDLAVYASQGWSPTHHARLASGCWSGSTGRDWLPAGFHLKGFKLPSILLSRASCARSDRFRIFSRGIGVRGIGPGRPGWLPTQVPHRSGLAHHAHPVPHLMNSRPARSVVVTWTWFRSRCTCQVSLQRLMRRHPLPSTGSLGLVPPLPRYSEVLRLPAAHFAALRFLRLAIPSLRPLFVPPAPDAEPWINRELVGGISSRLARWKRQGLPSSRRNPCDHSPYSSDPGVTRQAEWTMSELPGAAPATDHDEGSPRGDFGAQSHSV